MIVSRLRDSREDLNLKQKDVAKILDVDYSTVSGWETGKDTIPLERLIAYANHYELSLDYLFGITREKVLYKPLEINLELIANNLRTIRQANHLLQREIADKINTSQSAYAHYENALYLIPTSFIYNLYLIYKNLNVEFSIDEILGREKK